MRIILILTILLLCSCSKKEVKDVEKIQLEETEVVDSIQHNLSFNVDTPKVDNTRYYYASDFDLPPGKVVGFSPKDEMIDNFQSKGGDTPDEQIYIHILDKNGVIKVYECSYKAWLTIYEGSILK
jgi:hypothetical protein